MSVATVMPREAFERLSADHDAVMVDVRTPAEFDEIHADGARLIPLDRLTLDRLNAECGGSSVRSVYFICRSGQRAFKAAKEMETQGLENVQVIVGGTNAWNAEQLPVVRGRAAISLERQVRIAAGTMVLIGVVLSLWAHPWFIGVSAFVGAGLVFAGITDTCGMGMLLAKMPWNQRRAAVGPTECNING